MAAEGGQADSPKKLSQKMMKSGASLWNCLATWAYTPTFAAQIQLK
jgi:hypothetical protein